MAKKDDEKVTFTFSKSTLMLVLGIGLGLIIGNVSGYFLGTSLGETTGNVVAPTDSGDSGDAPAERVDVSTDDDPVLGDSDASITIIEFSDYQCPFCRRYFTQTYPQIKENYVDTGKVNMVYRDYPLSFHQQAKPMAEAAECSREQGEDLYWDVHDKFFNEQQEMNPTGTAQVSRSDIINWLGEVDGLDAEQVVNCWDSGKYSEEVDNDLEDGSNAGVRGTPAFFIGNEERGYTMVSGAQPYSVFEKVIENELSNA